MQGFKFIFRLSHPPQGTIAKPPTPGHNSYQPTITRGLERPVEVRAVLREEVVRGQIRPAAEPKRGLWQALLT